MTASNWEETERQVAKFFSEHGWPSCERRGRGYEGRELIGMPGLAPEVKSRRRLDLPAWLRQARRERDGGIPFVVHKPDGVRMGPSEIDIWPMTFPLLEGTYLLRAAGYGGPEPAFSAWLEAPDGRH
jgi:hypothetical protein